MKSDEEFIKELQNGENLPPNTSKNYVADVPNNFKKWHKDNATKFENWKTQPNFLEENKRYWGNDRLKNQRKEIKAWAKENLVGKTITHPNIDGEIHFTTTGIKEALNQPHKYIFEKNEAVKNIENLIKKGEYIRTDKDVKARDFLYHYLKTTINKENSFIVIKEVIDDITMFYTITDKIR